MSIFGWDRIRSPHPRRIGWRTSQPAVILALIAGAAGCDVNLPVDPAWASAPLPGPGYRADAAMADVGAELFGRNCTACHAVYGESVVGPNLQGVTERRDMAWIRAMIARPDSMLANDSIAIALLEEYQVPMVNRRLDGARVRAVVEFLWRADHPPASREPTEADPS